MEVNWIIIGILAICAIILIVFLIKQNLKDEKDLETFLNKTEFPTNEEETNEEI
jgi:hypothetical protein